MIIDLLLHMFTFRLINMQQIEKEVDAYLNSKSCIQYYRRSQLKETREIYEYNEYLQIYYSYS